MSKKKKTVTAPRSFDPGKGRPKEYLAYLNWQEMQALQRLNGEGPYKGPRGIPSFVLGGFGSAGSGTYSSSGQQQKSATTGARGPTGPRGEARASPAGNAGGGAGSVSRTSGSQEGSRQGGGGSGVGAGTSPGGTRGAGAARTVDSSGRTTGPSSSLNAPARTQPSADTSARQVAATNDASKALQSTSALKSDFQSGGIRQISVGPMGTPVTVGGQIKGAIRGVQEQASYAPAGSAFGPRAGLDRTVGTVSPSQIAADAAMNRLASGSNVLTGYPEKIQERVTPVPTSGPNRGLGTSPAAPARQAGVYLDSARNYPIVSTSRYAEANVGVPTTANTTGLAGVNYGSLATPEEEAYYAQYSSPRRAPKQPIERDPRRYAASTYTQSYDVPSGDMVDLTQEAYERERDYDVRPPVSPGEQYVAEAQPADAYAAEQFPKYVSPEVQQEMARIDRLNKIGVAVAKRAPVIGPIISAADTIRGVLTGTKTTAADAALKRQYMQSSDEQKAALETKYPNLTKFANDSGIGSQLPESNYTSWAAERGLTGSGARERGGNDGTNVGIAALPANRPAVTPSPGGGTGTSTPSGDRPYIHYQWDLGINIPSPGDPNYNDYQRYLEQRAAARAAYG